MVLRKNFWFWKHCSIYVVFRRFLKRFNKYGQCFVLDEYQGNPALFFEELGSGSPDSIPESTEEDDDAEKSYNQGITLYKVELFLKQILDIGLHSSLCFFNTFITIHLKLRS